MGQSKSGGYTKKDTVTQGQSTVLNQLLEQVMPLLQQAAEGYGQFLPGGQGGEAIKAQAQKDFQQTTIPSILNAYGTNAKGSSHLNQALASGAANLNTDIAAKLSEMALQAAGGIGNLASNAAGISTQTPQFAYMQKQTPFWQNAILASVNAAGQGAKAAGGGF